MEDADFIVGFNYGYRFYEKSRTAGRCRMDKTLNVAFMFSFYRNDKVMKRVNCLYRVSTKKQVDIVKDDIPMQRTACREFAER